MRPYRIPRIPLAALAIALTALQAAPAEAQSESDLAVTLEAFVAEGPTVTYTVRVQNLGPAATPDALVVDTLPTALSAQSADPSCSVTGGTIQCSVGPLAASEVRMLSITASVVDPQATSLVNQAVVTGAIPDPETVNNSAELQTPVDFLAPALVDVQGICGGNVIPILEDSELHVGLDGLYLQYSEPMWNPPGDAEAGDVTNVAGYLLLASGPDRGVLTASCDEPWIDEAVVPLEGALYIEETQQVKLTFDLASIPNQAEGQFRLLLCGGAQRDLAGLPIAGGGSTVARTFRLAQDNRFHNGFFDAGVASWIPSVGTAEDWSFSANDADWALSSGSGYLANLTGADAVAIEQCVVMPASDRLVFKSRILMPNFVADQVVVRHACTFYALSGCTGSVLGASDAAWTVAFAEEDSWTDLASDVVPADGTTSARCGLTVERVGNPVDVGVDEVQLAQQPTFGDDFELGNFSRWSTFFPVLDD